jgi:hypothetical protein
MTELVNSIITEAKHTEPFLKLPKSLTELLKIPISAPTIDLANIVKNKKMPNFLHTALYYTKLADTQVGANLLNSCNIVSKLVQKIWGYIQIIDPSVIIPPNTEDVFDFFTLLQYDPYDVKLTARYWAKEMYTLLDVIDNACRLAIKQQTRLALCLFEVCDVEVSVEIAYAIIMFNTKIQQENEGARESYIEYAKMFASMIDKIDYKILQKKMQNESVLYESLQMRSDLVENLNWLQKMLYKLPQSTIETWSHQMVLIGPWMNRLFIPWMKQCAEVGIFPSGYPLQRKKGPIEKVAKALAKPTAVTSLNDIKLVSYILKELYMNRDISDVKMDELDNVCIKRSGLNLVQWAAIIDASLKYEEVVSIEARPDEDILKDIETWKRKTKLAKEALDEFLRDAAFIDQDRPYYRLFAEHMSDIYTSLQKKEEKDNLLRQKNRFFPDLSESNFNLLVEFMIDYYKARDMLLKFKKELEAPTSNRARVTAYLTEQIKEQKDRYENRKKLFLIEANSRLGRQFDPDKFINYIDWYQKDGNKNQVTDPEKFKEDTEKKLNIGFKEVEPLLVFLEDVLSAAQVLKNLEIELNKHKSKLDFRRGVLSILIFILFGVMIFFLMQAFAPVYSNTPIPPPVSETTNSPIFKTDDQTPITEDTNPSSGSIFNTIGAFGDWIASTTVVQKIANRADIGLQDYGWRRFDWRGRIFSGDFWTDTIWRAGGGTIMTLLYAKVIVSTGWRILYFIWAASSALSNTAVSGIFDDNFSETWRQETLRVIMAGGNLGITLAANVLTVQTEYLQNQRHLFGMAAQALQYGPPALSAVGRQLDSYSQSPQRAAVTDRMNQEIEYYRAIVRGTPLQSQNTRPITADEITGPRITVIEDETETSNAVVPYIAPADRDYSNI